MGQRGVPIIIINDRHFRAGRGQIGVQKNNILHIQEGTIQSRFQSLSIIFKNTVGRRSAWQLNLSINLIDLILDLQFNM